MTALNKHAQLRKELSNPAIGSKDQLRKLAKSLLDDLEAKEEQRANWFQMAQKLGEDLEAAEKRIAELEARQGKPVMFIDGDISSADAEKLAAVIREFNEETETPAARMARIILENPHPTNMCDMPAAGIGVKGE